jgi:hypothetical protein
MRNPKEAYSYTGLKEFLDDNWKIIRNYNQFVDFIEHNWEHHKAFPSIIAFDHDLADEHYGAPINSKFKEKTGMDCAKWLIDFCVENKLTLPSHIVHSMNTAGRDNIHYLLENFRKFQKENGKSDNN